MPTTTKPPTAKRPQPSSRRGSVSRKSSVSAHSKSPDSHSGPTTPTHVRRPSVHFKSDGSGPQTRNNTVRSARGGDDVEFKHSMNDFLNVMYGEKADTGKGGTKGAQPQQTAKGSTAAPNAGSNRASQYRAAATAAPKGPVVKGMLANQANVPGDNIDNLVSHLVRAYSRSTSPGTGMHDDGETPISYGGGGQSARPRRHTGSQLEVNAFVSQAMDSFFVAPSGSGPLSSKRSMLSSLGMDDNFGKLLSFHPNSNMLNAEEEDTPVAPMYIGEMAMFNSVENQRGDVSVSKSMPMMMGGRHGATGAAASPSPQTGGTTAANARRANLNMSLKSGAGPSAGTGRSATGPVAGRRAVGRTGGLNREMSLDSKAIGGALGNRDDNDEADDSWADVDAEAVSEALKNSAAMGTKPALVSNTRSLMTMSRTKADTERAKKIKALVEEETLSRNVLLAVEHQLRGYTDTAYADASKKYAKRPASSAAKKKP